MLAYVSTAAEWLFWTLLASLAQLWWDLLTHLHEGLQFDLFRELQPGILLFVALATTWGVAIDYHLDEALATKGSFFRRLWFFAIPMLVMVFVFWAYSISRQINPSDADRTSFITLNVYSIGLCAIYVLGSKTYLLMHQRQEKRQL
jgi:hypothetical protein